MRRDNRAEKVHKRDEDEKTVFVEIPAFDIALCRYIFWRTHRLFQSGWDRSRRKRGNLR